LVASQSAARYGGRGKPMGVFAPCHENAGCAAWSSGYFYCAPCAKGRLAAVGGQHLSVFCHVPLVGVVLATLCGGAVRCGSEGSCTRCYIRSVWICRRRPRDSVNSARAQRSSRLPAFGAVRRSRPVRVRGQLSPLVG